MPVVGTNHAKVLDHPLYSLQSGQYQVEWNDTSNSVPSSREPRSVPLDPIHEQPSGTQYSVQNTYTTNPSSNVQGLANNLSQISISPSPHGYYQNASTQNQYVGQTDPVAARESTWLSQNCDQQQALGGRPHWNHIFTQNPETDREEFDPRKFHSSPPPIHALGLTVLDYKVHKPWEFKYGRVFFPCLWCNMVIDML